MAFKTKFIMPVIETMIHISTGQPDLLILSRQINLFILIPAFKTLNYSD